MAEIGSDKTSDAEVMAKYYSSDNDEALKPTIVVDSNTKSRKLEPSVQIKKPVVGYMTEHNYMSIQCRSEQSDDVNALEKNADETDGRDRNNVSFETIHEVEHFGQDLGVFATSTQIASQKSSGSVESTYPSTWSTKHTHSLSLNSLSQEHAEEFGEQSDSKVNLIVSSLDQNSSVNYFGIDICCQSSEECRNEMDSIDENTAKDDNRASEDLQETVANSSEEVKEINLCFEVEQGSKRRSLQLRKKVNSARKRDRHLQMGNITETVGGVVNGEGNKTLETLDNSDTDLVGEQTGCRLRSRTHHSVVLAQDLQATKKDLLRNESVTDHSDGSKGVDSETIRVTRSSNIPKETENNWTSLKNTVQKKLPLASFQEQLCNVDNDPVSVLPIPNDTFVENIPDKHDCGSGIHAAVEENKLRFRSKFRKSKMSSNDQQMNSGSVKRSRENVVCNINKRIRSVQTSDLIAGDASPSESNEAVNSDDKWASSDSWTLSQVKIVTVESLGENVSSDDIDLEIHAPDKNDMEQPNKGNNGKKNTNTDADVCLKSCSVVVERISDMDICSRGKEETKTDNTFAKQKENLKQNFKSSPEKRRKSVRLENLMQSCKSGNETGNSDKSTEITQLQGSAEKCVADISSENIGNLDKTVEKTGNWKKANRFDKFKEIDGKGTTMEKTEIPVTNRKSDECMYGNASIDKDTSVSKVSSSELVRTQTDICMKSVKESYKDVAKHCNIESSNRSDVQKDSSSGCAGVSENIQQKEFTESNNKSGDEAASALSEITYDVNEKADIANSVCGRNSEVSESIQNNGIADSTSIRQEIHSPPAYMETQPFVCMTVADSSTNEENLYFSASDSSPQCDTVGDNSKRAGDTQGFSPVSDEQQTNCEKANNEACGGDVEADKGVFSLLLDERDSKCETVNEEVGASDSQDGTDSGLSVAEARSLFLKFYLEEYCVKRKEKAEGESMSENNTRGTSSKRKTSPDISGRQKRLKTGEGVTCDYTEQVVKEKAHDMLHTYVEPVFIDGHFVGDRNMWLNYIPSPPKIKPRNTEVLKSRVIPVIRGRDCSKKK